jgi:hypothetical protein
MRRPPVGAAFITDILAPQEDLQPVLGGLEIPDGILAGAGQVADDLVMADLRVRGLPCMRLCPMRRWLVASSPAVEPEVS